MMLLLPRNIQALACCAGACLQSFCTWGNFNRRRWGIFNRRKLGNFQPALTLRMVGRTAPHCQNRSEFYGVAARLMRQILIDHARTRQAGKRGGHVVRLSLEEELIGSRGQDASLMELDEALNRLAVLDSRKSQVVELRFFGGLSVEETAEALKVSEVTVRRDWQFAKAWLLHELRGAT
jgi:RNA polymerase sigma-70 factor (ECF subfamily)